MPLESGFLLSERYCIENVLGHGGMGAVYLATDQSLGIQCAVKENLNLSPDSERQFRREASLLASLRHPNLPRVTNHFILGGQQYLVMDYVEGEDLKERLAREHPLSEAQVVRWIIQICDALVYLHGHQPPIIHRDIKPANIKLTAGGEAMLVDFGIAKATGSGQKTTTGAVALTPGFAPPEQYGMGHTDGRTDEYALGATLYALLTGHMPPDSMERLLGNIPLAPPDELRPDLSPAVSAAVMRALEVRPDDRFPTVADFKAALLGEISSQRTVMPSARETVMANAQATIVRSAPETIMAAGAARAAAPDEAEVEAPPVKPTGRSNLLWLLPFGLIAAVLLVGGGVTLALLPKLFPAATATLAPTLTLPAVVASLTSVPTLTLPPPVVSPSPVPPVATFTPALPAATTTLAATVTATAEPPTATMEPSPTLPPAPPIGGGGLIAFVSNRDGQRFQVYTMRPDGSEVKQLTTDDVDKWSPTWTFHGTVLAWSPDGTQLLYVAPGGAAATLNIWLVNADGSNPHNISAAEPGKASGDDYNPAWCKDGTIAFTTKRFNNVPQIVTMTLENPRLRNTSLLDRQGNNPNEWNPVFFPQNCSRMLNVTVQNGMPEIWRVFPDKASWRVFLSDINGYGASTEEPAISPNEKFVAYTRYGTKTKDVVNVTIDTENYSPRTMQLNSRVLTTTGNNSSPQWSPDSKFITFVSQRDSGKKEIYVMTSAGTDQHRISDLDRATLDSTAPDNVSPVWQPPAP
jgi:eukaryotic-like serine/threonine-protein kinase